MDARIDLQVFLDSLGVGDRINARRIDAAGLHPRLQAPHGHWIGSRFRLQEKP